MRIPIPAKLLERLKPVIDRVEGFLRTWEWTWTRAVLFSLGLAFFLMIFLAVIHSWFLYFADSELGWTSFWLKKLRDAIAAGWITTWFGVILVGPYIVQNWRRRLRGEGGESRPSGGYR